MNEYGPVTEIETTGVPGVTAFEGADSGLSPAELLACTVKVYVVPFVRPETIDCRDEVRAPAVACLSSP